MFELNPELFEYGVATATFLVGAYYGIKKIKDTIFSSKKKKEGKQYWNIHSEIHEILTELRIRTDAARSQIIQFHNGEYFIDGVSMKKMSLTHESLRSGISAEVNQKKDVLISAYIDFIRSILDSKYRFEVVGAMKESYQKQLFIASNVVAYMAVPLQSKGINIGYVIVHWCSDEKVEKVKEQTTSNELKYAKDRIEVQLGQQIALGTP
jgi:Fe2+ transport system protein B